MEQTTSTALVLFAKSPQWGTVKTRLANSLGNDVALALHIAFVNDCLISLSQLPQPSYFYLTSVWNEKIAPLPKMDSKIEIRYQDNGDLGDRLAMAMVDLFALGHQAVIIVGSDSPNLPLAYIAEAVIALTKVDVVLGPAEDGGYYLIGLTKQTHYHLSRLFRGIQWGSETVLSETLSRIEQAALTLHQLPPWYDVDTIADLKKLKSALLNGVAHLCPYTREVIKSLAEP